MRKLLIATIVVLILGGAVAAVALWPAAAARPQVLFVCTSNFYRSRFSEALFNQQAQAAHLPWRAFSRGTKLTPGRKGMSPYAQEELAKRGVPDSLSPGDPVAVTEADLLRCERIVVLYDRHDQHLLIKQFPQLDPARIVYWYVRDADADGVPAACELMTTQVKQLLNELATPPAAAPRS